MDDRRLGRRGPDSDGPGRLPMVGGRQLPDPRRSRSSVQGKPVMSVTQRIGWDPLARQFRSWEFDSEGGFGEGRWSRDGERWVVKHTGVRPEGTTASATNIMTQEPPRPGALGLDRPGRRRRVGARATTPTCWSASPPRRARRPSRTRRGRRPPAPNTRGARDDPQDDELIVRRRPAGVGARRRTGASPEASAAVGSGGGGGFAAAAAGSAAAAYGGGFRGGGFGAAGSAAATAAASFGRTPSFSSAGSFEARYGGGFAWLRSRGGGGDARGQIEYGPARAPTRPARRDHRLRRGGRRPRARAAARPGAASCGVGHDGGRPELRRRRPRRRGVGPGGNAVGGRSNIGVASGRAGRPSAARGASRVGRGARGTDAAGGRGGVGRTVAGTASRAAAYGASAYPALRLQRLRRLSLGLGPRLLERPQRRRLGLA